MSVDLYGIKSCNNVRFAIEWLKSNKIDFNFVDLKLTKLHEDEITNWLKKITWSQLINKNSLTWRALKEEEKVKIIDNESAKKLIIKHPLVMKRPIIKFEKDILVGFSEKKLHHFAKSESKRY